MGHLHTSARIRAEAALLYWESGGFVFACASSRANRNDELEMEEIYFVVDKIVDRHRMCEQALENVMSSSPNDKNSNQRMRLTHVNGLLHARDLCADFKIEQSTKNIKIHSTSIYLEK